MSQLYYRCLNRSSRRPHTWSKVTRVGVASRGFWPFQAGVLSPGYSVRGRHGPRDTQLWVPGRHGTWRGTRWQKPSWYLTDCLLCQLSGQVTAVGKVLASFPGAREIIKCTSHQGHGCPVPTLQVRRPGLRGSTSPSRARARIHSSVRSQVPWVLPVPSPHSPPEALCIQQVLTKCLRRERIRRCWGSFILFQGRLPRTQDGAMPQGSRTQDTP